MSVNEYENDINLTFKKDLEDYKMKLNPVATSMQHISSYINKVYKLGNDESIKLAKDIVKKSKPVNPTVTYFDKKENGDMESITNSLTGYLKDTIDDGNIIVPSFTNYTHPSKKTSIHSEFLFMNVALRSSDKKQSFKYKLAGDRVKQDYYETMQKIRKIFNNSVSGAYGSKGTILSNYSAHYTLTSITRSVASIGNAITESMVAGNKYFKDADVTLNYIVAIVNGIKEEFVKLAINKYKLYVPTAEECLEMILYSSRWYWKDLKKEEIILTYLKSLTDEERTAVMYTNDLWHLKEYNDEFMRTLVSEMGKSKENITDNPLDAISKAPEGIMNLVHLICSEDIKGLDVNYNNLVGTPLLDKLGSTAKGIMNAMDKYWILFRAFYTTDIMPTNIAYLKDMLRDSIVLSDTDSTCGSYDKWVNWYYGEDVFHAESIGIAGAIMTINNQIMDHFIKVFAANMNIEKKHYDILKMKNEFYWSVFIATNAGKHYLADACIQEGKVYKESDLELKGVHLIASKMNLEIRKLIHKIIADLLKAIKNKEPVMLVDYVEKTAKIELGIIKSITDGDVSIFKRMPIKEPKSYKQGPLTSPYQYHTLWEDIFSLKYGSPGIPPYTMVKIPLELNNKTEIKNWLETIKDVDIKEKMTTYIETKNVTAYKTFRLPLEVAKGRGIPEEILNVIGSKKIVTDSLKPLYLVLETLGYYVKPNKCIYELIEIEENDGKEGQ